MFVPSIQGANGLVGARYDQCVAENGKQAEQSNADNGASNRFKRQHQNVVTNGCGSVRLDDEGTSDSRHANRTLRTVVICLVLSGSAAVPSTLLAQPASNRIPPCVDAFEPDLAPNPAPALDPMRRFAVELGPYKLSVPWSYFAGGPRANLPSCKLDIKRLAIRFRFAGGTALSTGEIDRSYNSDALWDDAPADLVQVQAIHFYEQTPEDYFDPSRRYRNAVRAANASGSIRMVNGLQEIKFGGPADKRTDWYLSTEETAAFISCDFVGLCTGFVNLKDLHLSAHMTLKEQSILDLRAIDAVLRNLISSWREIN